MAKKPFPFKVCEQCCDGSGGSGESDNYVVNFQVGYNGDDGMAHENYVDKSPDEIIDAIRSNKNVYGICILEGEAFVYSRNYTVEDVEVKDPWTDETSTVTRITFDFICGRSLVSWTYYPDYGETWMCKDRIMTDESYVDTAIGDIETALDNIITKYGLGGDAI